MALDWLPGPGQHIGKIPRAPLIRRPGHQGRVRDVPDSRHGVAGAMMEAWSILTAGTVTSRGTVARSGVTVRSGCVNGTPVTAARCAASRPTGWAAVWQRG